MFDTDEHLGRKKKIIFVPKGSHGHDIKSIRVFDGQVLKADVV